VPQHDLDAAAGLAERRFLRGRLLHQGFSHSEQTAQRVARSASLSRPG
jgi:hypothetical protein